MKALCLTAFAIALATPTFATDGAISVEFRESAPKDSFIISNSGACPVNGMFTIDMEKSAGLLIFDTTSRGAGVEVFQPFELTTGSQFLANTPLITDGDKVITLDIENMGIGEQIVFTIDVDDTLKNSSLGQIRVTGSEISGAMVQILQDNVQNGTFGSNARANIATGTC